MLFKVIISGLLLCLINMLLKNKLSEFIVPGEIAFLAFVTYILIEYFENTYSGIINIIKQTEHFEELYSVVIKAIGICLITKFSSDICLESGNKLVSDVIEFIARIMLVILAMPYIESIIKTALSFIK